MSLGNGLLEEWVNNNQRSQTMLYYKQSITAVALILMCWLSVEHVACGGDKPSNRYAKFTYDPKLAYESSDAFDLKWEVFFLDEDFDRSIDRIKDKIKNAESDSLRDRFLDEIKTIESRRSHLHSLDIDEKESLAKIGGLLRSKRNSLSYAVRSKNENQTDNSVIGINFIYLHDGKDADDLISIIRYLPNLEYLNLMGVPINDNLIKKICQLNNLKCLVAPVAINDNQIKTILKGVPTINYLVFDSCSKVDGSFANESDTIKNLVEVSFYDTPIYANNFLNLLRSKNIKYIRLNNDNYFVKNDLDFYRSPFLERASDVPNKQNHEGRK